MSAESVTMTRCPYDDSAPRAITKPCPKCGRMVPGQPAPQRTQLIQRLSTRIDGALPGTSAVVLAGLAAEDRDDT